MARPTTIWLGPMFLLLASCATISVSPNAPMVAPRQLLNLPHPADLGRSVLATQLITLRSHGQTFLMEMNLSVTPARAVLIGLDPMGRRAMTITWTDENVSVEMAPWMPDSLRPGSVLADIILIYWPEATVRKALPAGSEVLQEAYGRTIRINGQEVLHVDYTWASGARWNGKLRYTNFAWGYVVDVQSSE